MKTKTLNIVIIAAVAVVAFVLGLLIMVLPSPSADLKGFSAEKAYSYLEKIAEKPHSVFDEEAHDEVEQYLKTTLESMGHTVEVHNWTPAQHGFSDNITPDKILDYDKPVEYDITNLAVKIQGKRDNGILIMAHYDSRGHASRTGEIPGSYGAADDGYGVAVMLEIARIYANVPAESLENSIYLCFTDAEETGLYGSQLEMQLDYIDNVNFVINIEARGVKGPAYMFETSKNNSKVIELYKNADMPFSYSLATAVYSVMPNFTDFTSALDMGKQGINFAVLDNLYYYHTPADNISAVNKSSLQHYGSQIMPVIAEYVSDAKYGEANYFDADSDSVFFNILPTVMAVYSQTAAIIFVVLCVLACGAGIFLAFKKGKLRPKKALIALGVVALALVASAVFGLAVSYLVALIGGVPWKLTYVRVSLSGIPFALSYAIVLGLIIWFCIKKFTKDGQSKFEFFAAGIVVNALLALLTTFFLPGASFLFLWPALIGSVSLIVNALFDNYAASHVLLSLNIVIMLLFAVPLLYSFFLALSIGGLAVLNLLLVIMLAVVLPSVFIQLDLKRKSI